MVWMWTSSYSFMSLNHIRHASCCFCTKKNMLRTTKIRPSSAIQRAGKNQKNKLYGEKGTGKNWKHPPKQLVQIEQAIQLKDSWYKLPVVPPVHCVEAIGHPSSQLPAAGSGRLPSLLDQRSIFWESGKRFQQVVPTKFFKEKFQIASVVPNLLFSSSKLCCICFLGCDVLKIPYRCWFFVYWRSYLVVSGCLFSPYELEPFIAMAQELFLNSLDSSQDELVGLVCKTSPKKKHPDVPEMIVNIYPGYFSRYTGQHDNSKNHACFFNLKICEPIFWGRSYSRVVSERASLSSSRRWASWNSRRWSVESPPWERP